MSNIHIGSITVPLADYAVGASAVLGIRDSGKTVTSKGIAEQLLENHIPIVVFDAVGKWRWLKVAGEQARGKGYKVVVAGGRGADLPLTPHSVPEIVRSALKERIPLIIDLFDKALSKADWRRIVQTAIHIIHYENEGGAVHVFLEEAAEFVPQKVYDGETYAEVEKLVRMGGNASVGITLINQRSQEVNKAVLDNCSTALILGCQVGKNAIEAVEKWIERLDPRTAEELTKSLPKLQSGEAWVWTRRSLDQPTREKFPMCRSFHPDRRTPEVVIRNAKPTDTAEFVAKLAGSIPKVIEEAKANDPAELKKQLSDLRRQLAARPVLEKSEPIIQKVSVFEDPDRELLDAALKTQVSAQAMLQECQREMVEQGRRLNELVAAVKRATTPMVHARPAPRLEVVPQRERQQNLVAGVKARHERNGDLGAAQRAFLTVLANRQGKGTTRNQIAVIAGYSATSAHVDNVLSELRTSGYVEGSRGNLSITQDGLSALGNYDQLPTGSDLLQHWLGKLPAAPSALLRTLADVFPGVLTRDEAAEQSGYSVTSAHVDNSISALRTRELITGSRQALKASEEFFQ